ncbi:hypothetical protein AHAS_Ahas08G0096000 [Arachis hypogaea]
MVVVAAVNRNPLRFTNPPQNLRSPCIRPQTLALPPPLPATPLTTRTSPPPPSPTPTLIIKTTAIITRALLRRIIMDFRYSMLQMILQKEIFSESGLQELLQCFLELNSPCQHQIIVQAFMEICEETFPKKFCDGEPSSRK